MVPGPGFSLRFVLFGAQCDKPRVSTSTSGQCLFHRANNTVKGRERKCLRNSGTSDYKTGYERALLTARNLQSERDRVVNVLRKLSNESARGKQYGGQKDRRRDRAPEMEQTQRNKHARQSGWELHETWRQLLIKPRSVWRNNAPKIALVFHAALPSGVPCIVNARRRLQELVIRPDRVSCKCMACKWDLPWPDLFADPK